MREFPSTLGASLIRDFSGNHDNKLKFINHFLPFLKTVPWDDRTLKRTSFWTNKIKSGPAQQEKIGLEASAKLLHYLLT